MKNKWFIINEEGKTFESKRRAKTKEEAWSKTLLKWGLKADGYTPTHEPRTCGFCDYSNDFCEECLIGSANTGYGCVAMANTRGSSLQYLWLLFVREASK